MAIEGPNFHFDSASEVLLSPSDIEKLVSQFQLEPMSKGIISIIPFNKCFFSLQLNLVTDSDENLKSLETSHQADGLETSYFLLSKPWSCWVQKLLALNAFDVNVGPMRLEEFLGKLNYYFSDSYQSYLIRRSSLFKLELTKKEQELFDFLARHPKGVTRKELMTLCWKNIVVHPKTLDVHLFNLRQKLERIGGVVHFVQGNWYLKFK